MDYVRDPRFLEYEQELARNPYSLKSWLRYLYDTAPDVQDEDRDESKVAPPRVRYGIYERALKLLPMSYKLWRMYLQERWTNAKRRSVRSKALKILVNTYERALVHLHRMPRIWLDYSELLVHLRKGTAARKVFDRALQALPVTQHERIWEPYLRWAKSLGVKETAVRVYRRYLMLCPNDREQYIQYLVSVKEWAEVAKQLALCVNDDKFESPTGTSKHTLWMQLCNLCAKHPEECKDALPVEAIIRSGAKRFSDEVGKLWCRLADFHVRLGEFERARDVYEEALHAVLTVRDFSLVFDAYVTFEEKVVTAKLAMLEEQDEEDEEDDGDIDGDDVDFRLARLEHLTAQRPFLINAVLLRQNPHNVSEWIKRGELYRDKPAQAALAYRDAIQAIDPQKAVGRPLAELWIAFAQLYVEQKDLDSARLVFRKAVDVPFRTVDELASVYCYFCEVQLLHENFEEAFEIINEAVAEPVGSLQRRRKRAAASGRRAVGKDAGANLGAATAKDRLHRNARVWSLYLDMEESLGTPETVRAAYDRILELRAATSQMVLNYAKYLQEHEFFEEAFRVYERGVSVFKFPHSLHLWRAYITDFIARYRGSKMERAREILEQACMQIPAEGAAEFYVAYAKLEEKYGLARHTMAVLDRACSSVPQDQKLAAYKLYVSKASALYGATRARPIYEKGRGARAVAVRLFRLCRLCRLCRIKDLPDAMAVELCKDFADLEIKLGEVDRARAIYGHGAQFADPNTQAEYWKKWQEFEVAHGNKDTFRFVRHCSPCSSPRGSSPVSLRHRRDMLRIQRSVKMAYGNVNYMATEMLTSDNGQPLVAQDHDANEAAKVAFGKTIHRRLPRARCCRPRKSLYNHDLVGAGAPSNIEGFVPSTNANASAPSNKRKADDGASAESEMAALERQVVQRCNGDPPHRFASRTNTGLWWQAARAKTDAVADAEAAGVVAGQGDAGAGNGEEEEEEEDENELDLDLEERAVPDAVFGQIRKAEGQKA
eukprot:scaffold7031_cov254-Pinguiococcus_pyrenoidosus.AAC.11